MTIRDTEYYYEFTYKELLSSEFNASEKTRLVEITELRKRTLIQSLLILVGFLFLNLLIYSSEITLVNNIISKFIAILLFVSLIIYIGIIRFNQLKVKLYQQAWKTYFKNNNTLEVANLSSERLKDEIDKVIGKSP
ncbi:MAG: hypothetical protein ACXAB7_12290 [Candidatus Kariarchaeaceae archaeon]|jgi:hypothetical protein